MATRTIKTIGKISLTLVLTLALLSFPSVFASGIYNANLDSSIYRYNALESNNSYPDQAISIASLGENLPKSNGLPNDITKGLQDITEKQDFSTIQINDAISVLQNRSGLKTFLVGNNLGILKFQTVQIEDQISVLNALSLETQDSANKTQIDSQMKFLKEEQTKVENFLLEQNDKFSLFGWFVKIL